MDTFFCWHFSMRNLGNFFSFFCFLFFFPFLSLSLSLSLFNSFLSYINVMLKKKNCSTKWTFSEDCCLPHATRNTNWNINPLVLFSASDVSDWKFCDSGVILWTNESLVCKILLENFFCLKSLLLVLALQHKDSWFMLVKLPFIYIAYQLRGNTFGRIVWLCPTWEDPTCLFLTNVPLILSHS